MDFCGKIITAPLIFLNGNFQENIQIKIDENGQIEAIGKKLANSNVLELKNLALVPGFVNAHSHAFHRLLRGQSQIGSSDGDSFWKWRQNMYQLVDQVTYNKLKKYCMDTFLEMLSAGITTVGEFHYVHHSLRSGTNDFQLDMAVVEAAMETGIRMVLIQTLYSRAGFDPKNSQLSSQQQRFGSEIEEFVGNLEKFVEKTRDFWPQISIAVSVHSLRAVGKEALKLLWKWAKTNKMSFHIHLEEQPKEIEDCLEFEGKRPSNLLLDEILSVVEEEDNKPLDRLTAVHCTYTTRENLDTLSKLGAQICICPLTEGFLGDGIPNLNCIDKICLGTDCNNRISFVEEMRWLCYKQNAKNNSRNCAKLNAEKLLKIATQNGAKALNLENMVGEFRESLFMDFVGFDLKSNRLKDFSQPNDLLDSLVFGAGNEEISLVVVGGKVRFSK